MPTSARLVLFVSPDRTSGSGEAMFVSLDHIRFFFRHGRCAVDEELVDVECAEV